MLAQKWLGHSVTCDDGVIKVYNQFGKSWTTTMWQDSFFGLGIGLQRWSVCSSSHKQKKNGPPAKKNRPGAIGSSIFWCLGEGGLTEFRHFSLISIVVLHALHPRRGAADQNR